MDSRKILVNLWQTYLINFKQISYLNRLGKYLKLPERFVFFMKKLLLILLLISSALRAQETIDIGTKHSVFSSILNENRSYWVYLPPLYDDERYGKAHYPVIYLLDGEKFFHTLISIQNNYTRGMYNNMPECIVVGVINTDRTRDMTPSRSSVIHNGIKRYENSGGGGKFTQFLTEELRSVINNNYRTNGYNLLVGHSFGGLATLSVFSDYTDSFNAYIAIDPSTWWDDYMICKKIQKKFINAEAKNKQLYIAFSTDKEGIPTSTNNIDNLSCTSILTMKNYKEDTFDGENHGTVVIPGISNGLRYIFDGIELPVKDVPSNPELIKDYYKKLSEKTGFTFIPDEIVVDNIGKYAIQLGEKENARKIFEYNIENYPDSKNAQKSIELTRK